MAHRKVSPERVRSRWQLADRLRTIRVSVYGDCEPEKLAQQMGVPVRTWYSYEAGVRIPAEVLLRFVDLTGVETSWLLHGRGPQFQAQRRHPASPRPSFAGNGGGPSLERVFQGNAEPRAPECHDNSEAPGEPDPRPLTPPTAPWHFAAAREWQPVPGPCPCVQVDGDAMAPIIGHGEFVGYSETMEDAEVLHGNLVVIRGDGEPRVRWFQRSGRFAVLRAQNPGFEPRTQLIDLGGDPGGQSIRRVLWISTHH
jgi:phage repressor protein C with HTH and peptisase S24 domain